MQFSLEHKTASLSVGEFADFTLGPRESGGGASGLWRAQLGQQWHGELRARTAAATPGARFEVPVEGRLVHRGWAFTLAGRIDQLVPTPAGGVLLREIKTVTRPLPADDSELRAEYPGYFLQLAAYLVLGRTFPTAVAIAPTPSGALAAELVFVEVSSGLAQAIALTPFDEALVSHQLDVIAGFLDLRLRATARRRSLRFRPAFATLRPGQETIQADLATALGFAMSVPNVDFLPDPRDGGAGDRKSEIENRKSKILLFEAPTGYGKTGCVLEFALGQMRAGRFARLVWLTSKATGQLQVMRTLAAMTVPADACSEVCHPIGDKLDTAPPAVCHPIGDKPPAATPVAAWQVRPKAEHCVNPTLHCVRDACAFLAGCAERWPQSGLARFYRDDASPHDLAALRAAGIEARICPYEITRAALAFNDVWIGDYNYVFAPDNRGLFYEQPGFDPAETLLVIDEAHNLPARVADAFSHIARADDARAVLGELHRVRALASLLLAWEHWAHLLATLPTCANLGAAPEAEIYDAVAHLANQVLTAPLDYAKLGPQISALLWQAPALLDFVNHSALEKLLHCPRAGELHFTCLDAAPVIGDTLRAFGGVVLMSATLSPVEAVAAACGLDEVGRVVPDEPAPTRLTGTVRPTPPERLGDLNKRETKKLYRHLTSAADLLRVEEERDSARPRFLRAPAPWRDAAYEVAVDIRVETTLRRRGEFYPTTAATVEALHLAALRIPRSAIAIFFPSYAYAEAVQRACAAAGSALRVALQPRLSDLAAQSAWVEESLAGADALFLVLGSSFAEGIDVLGGRVSHALVVGPALPEVNAVQRARLAAGARAGLSRDAAFRRVYQIPGMIKVNQALGRLVRAPGQRTKVLLHCRRFAEPGYAALLAPEYRQGHEIATDAGLAAWLGAR